MKKNSFHPEEKEKKSLISAIGGEDDIFADDDTQDEVTEAEDSTEESADKKPEKAKKKLFAGIFKDIKDSFTSRSFKAGGYSLALCAVVIALAVVVNLLVGTLPGKYTQIDTTPSGVYTLSQQSIDVSQALTKDIELVWVVSDSAEDQYLEELLDNYSEQSSHIKVVKLNPVYSPTRLKQYCGDDIDADSIEDNSVIVVCGGIRKLLAYRYDIYTYSDYSTYYEYYYYYGSELLDSFCAERSITAAIGYVTSDELPVMYVLEGHGETDISSLYDEIEYENIMVETLNLNTTGAVPEDCDCLLIAAPESDISTAEREILREYVAGGGKLLLMTWMINCEDLPNLTGLMSEEYGVSLVNGMVIEEDSDYHYVGFPSYIYPELNSHEITDPLIDKGYRVMLPNCQGMTISETLPEGVSVSSLIHVDEEAFSHIYGDDETDDYDYSRAEGDISGPFELACAITVEAAGETEDGDDGDTDSAANGEIVWIGTVNLLADMVNEMTSGANMDLFLNSIGWLCEHEESVSVRTIEMDYDYLTMSEASATALSVVLIGVVPAVFLVEGLAVVIRRRRTK